MGRFRSLALIATMVIALPAAFAQTTDDSGPKQDMKNAGSDTKHAATSAGHGVSQGTKKVYHKTTTGTKKGYDKTKSGTEKGYDKTKSGTETGYHKTAHATKTGVHKVEGKPDTPANNPRSRTGLDTKVVRERAARLYSCTKWTPTGAPRSPQRLGFPVELTGVGEPPCGFP